MKLSVIIVNYNVEYFLEQCLNSVIKSSKGLDVEILVIDNNSIDGSCEMLHSKFPQVTLIENKVNSGFSKANNQGIAIAKGDYILLLNPDTVVQEDTFSKVIAFMDEHPDAGGLGVKMIDGKGNFLPESKRGLPTPSVAFYKIFGLSRIFPKSKRFGRYHLGFLDKNEVHEIDVLSGAFMLMRKSVLDQIGYLDEDFFMYGEDIDLSYRITKAGYKNYYFPHTSIIHYKGESTKKSSVNYVFVFYNAMIIFAKKHFSEKNAKTFGLLINFAIYLRAGVALVNRILKKIIVPIVDFACLIAGLFLIASQYEKLKEIEFPTEVLYYLLPTYALIWIGVVWLSSGYDKPIKISNIVKGILLGTGIILMLYALLPKEVQFSRIYILLASAYALVLLPLLRLLYHVLGFSSYNLYPNKSKRFAIIGNWDEAERVSELLKQTSNFAGYIAFINPAETRDTRFAGNMNQLSEVLDVLHIDEVIFCARDNSAQQIIDAMSKSENRKIEYKIAQPESLYLIGSNSINTSGDLYVLDINSINKVKNRRNKRLFDLLASLFLLVTLPIWMIVNPKAIRRIPQLFLVLIGKKTIVSYSLNNPSKYSLPNIKQGIITTSSNLKQENLSNDLLKKIDIIYAKDYKIATDLKLLLSAWFKMS